MSKDPIWEYLNTPANIAMQYFGSRNATNMIPNEAMEKYCTPIVVNMEESKYHHSKNPLNF